jgi:Fungal protein kinase
MGAQYRTHMFMVLIVKDYARLIRWDRSGAVVTESIKFNEQRHLYDFFIRYNVAEREACGHDSTVGVPSDAEVARAKSIVPELEDKRSFLTLTISDQRFVIHSPKSLLHVPVGHWTRVSFAFDIGNECRVLLKDSWRVLLDGIMPEGDIYLQLREGGVPNIPRCLLYSDVGHNNYH